MTKADIAKMTFATEEALLAYQSRFGEETGYMLTLDKRMGKVRMSVDVPGEAFDPVSERVPFDSEFP